MIPSPSRSAATLPGMAPGGGGGGAAATSSLFEQAESSSAAAPTSMKGWKRMGSLPCQIRPDGRTRFKPSARSEDHTSELQSLIRISYAVFCLKNKNKHRTQNRT